FDEAEHPVALQLGGSDPDRLAQAARIGADFGYDEINFNVGCPSGRVQSGQFGAALMAHPKKVAECVVAMKEAVSVPVTVKCRIGIDDQDSEADLANFASAQAGAGVDVLIVHARKAWLQGLSPKQNRDVPPLDWPRVHRLAAAMPDMPIVLNGGLASLDEASAQLPPEMPHLAGVMFGRAAYQTPFMLGQIDRDFFGATAPAPTRAEIVRAMLPYIETQCQRGTRLTAIIRHMLGLYHGRPNARAWRRHLTEGAVKPGAGPELVMQALALVEGGNQLPAPKTRAA
ncbi:MAG: tRNA dihydrouridine(20/20a) synthase DusA, partial [Alphaproteobacteria bacterium]